MNPNPDLVRERRLVEYYRRKNAGLSLRGETWEIRHKIQELGGLWDPLQSCWLMQSEDSMKSLNAINCGTYWAIANANGVIKRHGKVYAPHQSKQERLARDKSKSQRKKRRDSKKDNTQTGDDNGKQF